MRRPLLPLLLLTTIACGAPQEDAPTEAAPVIAARGEALSVATSIGQSGTSSLSGRAALPAAAVAPLSTAELLPGFTARDRPFAGSLSQERGGRALTVRQGGGPSTGAGYGPFLNSSGACTFNVRNQGGGRVLAAPKIHRLFWGNYWTQAAHTAEASSYDNTWTTLANSPSFLTRLSEYGVGAGSAGNRYNLSSGATGSVSEASIRSTIQSSLQSAGYYPGSNDLFVVFLPAGTTNQTDSNNGWAGHHDHFTWTVHVGRDTVDFDVVYAVIEYSSDANYTNPVVSHEIVEAATDPDLNAIYDGGGAEIGDICRFAYNNVAGVQVETVYSQKACRCVRERELNNLSYAGTGLPTQTVFRNGTWYGYWASSYWNFGQAGDAPLPFDANGDGRSEYALFRPSSSNWFILNTASGYYNAYALGQSGDIPVPADYDGDGKSDMAVWRPSNGTWYIINSSTGALTTTQWGTSGDIPVPGDYDGDGKADPTVRRPSNATWYTLNSGAPGYYQWAQWGNSTDVPVPGDFNGDGYLDWALFRPSEGRFYVWYKGTSTALYHNWGQSGDILVTRDYDGDWKSDPAVWRPSNGTWYVLNSSGGSSINQWGQNGDIPVEKSVQ